MNIRWRPMDYDGKSDYAPVEGIPDFMQSSIIDWIEDAEFTLCPQVGYLYSYSKHVVEERQRKSLIQKYERLSGHCYGLEENSSKEIFSHDANINQFGLEYVDFLLASLSRYVPSTQVLKEEPEHVDKASACIEKLEGILNESRSIWQIGERKGFVGLEKRVNPNMQQMADPIIRSDTSAGKHLSKAWNCAFGRIPDYSQAYSEAIKAVEAATTPVLSPKDADATLSKNAQNLWQQSGWHFEIEPTRCDVPGGPIRLLMTGMMNSQPDRHGKTQFEEVTKAKAEAAVFTAVFLVQNFNEKLMSRN